MKNKDKPQTGAVSSTPASGYVPSLETDMMTYLDMKIQGMNSFVKDLKRLGIYISLDVNYPNQLYVKHFTIKST